MNRRNLFLSAGVIFSAALTPTKTYSFIYNNPLRDDAKWLGSAGYVKGGEYIVRSLLMIEPGTLLDGVRIITNEPWYRFKKNDLGIKSGIINSVWVLPDQQNRITSLNTGEKIWHDFE